MSQNDKTPAAARTETADQRAERLASQIPFTHQQALGLVATSSNVDISMTTTVLELLRKGMEWISRYRGKDEDQNARAKKAYGALKLAELLDLPSCLITRREGDNSLRIESPHQARKRLVGAAKQRAQSGHLSDNQIGTLTKVYVLTRKEGDAARTARLERELAETRAQLEAAQAQAPLARSAPNGDPHDADTVDHMAAHHGNKVVSMVGHPATQRTNPGADNGLAPRKATGS